MDVDRSHDPVPRCLLVADHDGIVAALRELLEQLGLDVVAAAGNSAEALGELDRYRPDLAIVDLQPQDLAALSLASTAHETVPDTAFVLYTAEGSTDLVDRALSAGFRGVVCKAAPPTALIESIEAVLAGRTYVDDALRHVASG